MTSTENQRVKALGSLEAGRLCVEEVASALEVTPRHVRRLLERFRSDGAAGLAHGNRGRRPVHGCSHALGDQVGELATGKYAGFNQQHFTERLAAEEGILLSRSTVRRMLEARGIGAPRPQRRTRHRRRRLREGSFGSMLQLDASIHDWLEGRGPKFTLVGAIDDATGHVWARFSQAEDLEAYFSLLREIVAAYGVPGCMYTDRHLMFLGVRRYTAEEERRYQTQFTRLVARLGSTHIRAGSPQAKGRIERLWKTLQDRLVSELRAESVTTIGRANVVLRKHLRVHNGHFAVPPRSPEPAWRPLPEDVDIDDLFGRFEVRVVANDNTVRIFGNVVQLQPDADRGWAGQRVEVCRRQDGELRVYQQGRRLPACLIDQPSVSAA